MSLTDAIALWQAIIATLGLVFVIIGGFVAVQSYLKVIKSTDENAKERQQALDSVAEKYQLLAKDIENQLRGVARRNLYALGVLILCFVAMMFLERQDREK